MNKIYCKIIKDQPKEDFRDQILSMANTSWNATSFVHESNKFFIFIFAGNR